MKAEIYMKPFMICNGVANKRWCAWRLKNIIMKFFLNTSAIDYIAAPAHKFHEGELQSAAEEMGEEE